MVSEWDSSWSRGGSCALFIHFEHSWQPAWALMHRERERNRNWWCYVSLVSSACFVKLSWLPIVLFFGLPGQQGMGKGKTGGGWMEREVLHWSPTEQGKCSFVSGTARIAFHTPSTLLFMESVEKLPGNPSAVEPGQQDREGWHLSSASSNTPSALVPRNLNPSGLMLLSSPIWLTSACQQCFPGNPGAWIAASTQYGSHSWNSWWWENCLQPGFGAMSHASRQLSKSKHQPEDPWNITSPLITGLFPYNALLVWKNHSLLLCHSCRGIPAAGTYPKNASLVFGTWYSAQRGVTAHKSHLWVGEEPFSFHLMIIVITCFPCHYCHMLTNHLHLTFHSGAEVTS